MEDHRLKPMPVNYNRQLFEQIYHETKALRAKLVYGIDSRRFGVDAEEISSWFDVKFIYVFSKYYDQFIDQPGVLKGHIINALQLFRYRVLKEAYMDKNKQYLNKIEIGEIEYFENLISTEEDDEVNQSHNELIQRVTSFLRSKLSDDAYFILELQLNPPPFILHRLESLNNRRIGNIPNELLADYLGLLPEDKKVISYIGDLKREVKSALDIARTYFNNPEFQVS